MGNSYKNEIYLQYILSSCAAPVLANKKPSGLVTIWKHHLSNVELRTYCESSENYFLNGSKLEILLETKLYYLLFCYQREQLEAELEKNKNSKLLNEYFLASNLDEKIGQLRRKMKAYYLRNAGFPHEIGLFLGYPIWDVEGFIEHKGLEYKICGYWKVYDDVPGALQKFEEYDWIKRDALNRFYRQNQINNQKI